MKIKLFDAKRIRIVKRPDKSKTAAAVSAVSLLLQHSSKKLKCATVRDLRKKKAGTGQTTKSKTEK